MSERLRTVTIADDEEVSGGAEMQESRAERAAEQRERTGRMRDLGARLLKFVMPRQTAEESVRLLREEKLITKQDRSEEERGGEEEVRHEIERPAGERLRESYERAAAENMRLARLGADYRREQQSLEDDEVYGRDLVRQYNAWRVEEVGEHYAELKEQHDRCLNERALMIYDDPEGMREVVMDALVKAKDEYLAWSNSKEGVAYAEKKKQFEAVTAEIEAAKAAGDKETIEYYEFIQQTLNTSWNVEAVKETALRQQLIEANEDAKLMRGLTSPDEAVRQKTREMPWLQELVAERGRYEGALEQAETMDELNLRWMKEGVDERNVRYEEIKKLYAEAKKQLAAMEKESGGLATKMVAVGTKGLGYGRLRSNYDRVEAEKKAQHEYMMQLYSVMHDLGNEPVGMQNKIRQLEWKLKAEQGAD